ncbi:hypothetical protein T484DRAFT_1886359 [Baffinella frigidus]|nr:hypothetical protein T484DRAFT_1886359 [Cryptophyta sp. CCMP2293]
MPIFRPRRTSFSFDEEGVFKKLPDPVVVTRGGLEALMPLSLPQAAQKLGLSPTTFKKACRSVGLARWPYRSAYEKRKQDKAHRAPPLSTSPNSPASLPLSPTMSDRRAAAAHGSHHDDGAAAYDAWPSPPNSWPSMLSPARGATVPFAAPAGFLPTHEGRIVPFLTTTAGVAPPRHYTTVPSIVVSSQDFPVYTTLSQEGAAKELGEGVEAVLAYLEDFGRAGGHLASLLELVE